jgi:hypothetical protein
MSVPPSARPPSCAPLYDAVGEEFGTAADMYALALRRTDTRGTFIAATDTVLRSMWPGQVPHDARYVIPLATRQPSLDNGDAADDGRWPTS